MWRHAFAAASIVALLAGCHERKLRYDDLDLAPAKSAFTCAPGLGGDKKEACRMLEEFAAADAFTAWPAKGLDTWFGRKVCTDAIDATNRIDFARVHLMPGVGKAVYPAGMKTDASRDVPYGAEFIAASASAVPADAMKGYRLTIDAAAAGAEPNFDAIAEVERAGMKRFWDDSKKTPGTTDFWRLVKMDGKSVTGSTYTTDIEGGPSASYFMRGKGNKMLLVWASNDPKVPWCVGEAWRIFATL